MSIDFSKYTLEQAPKGLLFGVQTKELLHSEISKFQKIEVYETEHFGKMLLNDDVVMLWEKYEECYHEMIGHIPLLYHPNPKKILIIGGGDGGVAREALKHSTVEQVTQVEIDEAVVNICKKYFPYVASSYSHPKMNLIIDDGIKFVKETKEKFDVVIVDSTDPAGPSEGLFKKSFYEDVYNILNEDGILTTQGECVYTMPDIQKEVADTLKSIFPYNSMYMSYIPFYTPGCWSLMFASKAGDTRPAPRVDFLDSINNLKYLNKDVITGCFAIPNFAKDILS